MSVFFSGFMGIELEWFTRFPMNPEKDTHSINEFSVCIAFDSVKGQQLGMISSFFSLIIADAYSLHL